MKKGYHSVIGKIPNVFHMPPSREGRVLDAITLMNNHLLINGFSNWKTYSRKCLELKTYYNQRFKRKIYLLWKHHTLKKNTLRTREANYEESIYRRLTKISLESWKRFTAKNKFLNSKFDLISSKITKNLY
jgi:hypothetical protein